MSAGTTLPARFATTWLTRDPDDGLQEHDTERIARAVFATVVDCLTTEAEDPTGDGWHPDAEQASLWLAVRVDRLVLRTVATADGDDEDAEQCRGAERDYLAVGETKPLDIVAALRALADQIADQRKAARDEQVTAVHS